MNRNGAETEDRVLDIAFDVNLKHDVYISPRVIDRFSTLSDPVWSITPFLRVIAKEGIPLAKWEFEKLARHRLGCAKEAFAEGEHLLTKNAFMGAVSRFYYAAFYAARSFLALSEAFKRPRSLLKRYSR